MYFGVSQSRAREVVEKHREKNEGVRPFVPRRYVSSWIPFFSLDSDIAHLRAGTRPIEALQTSSAADPLRQKKETDPS